jgi:O-antigen/teichoic acid export membrane protein
MGFRDFAKDVGITGLTQVVASICGFLLLPIITKAIGTEGYGIWTQIAVTVSLLAPLAMLGLSNSYVRFLSAERDEDVRREGFYSISLFILVSGTLVSILMFLLARPIADLVIDSPGAYEYVQMGSFWVLLSSLDIMMLYYFRIYNQMRKFFYLVSLNSVGKVAVISLLLSYDYGLTGVILGTLGVQSVEFLIGFAVITRQIGFTFPKFSNIREYLRFGTPLTPNSIIKWVTDSSDRYLIGFLLGIGSVGVYGAAYSLGCLINYLTTPLQFMLFPELTKQYEEKRMDMVERYLERSIRYFLLLAIPAAAGLSILAEPLLEILTTPDFIVGKNVVPLVAFGALFAGVFQMVINVTMLTKQTSLNMYIHLFAAVLNIGLNLLLIPRMGIEGAAIATIAAYALICVLGGYVSYQKIRFHLDWAFIAKAVLSALVMAGALYLLAPKGPVWVLLSLLVGVVVYFGTMFLVRAFDRHEMAILRKVMERGARKH